MSGVPNIPIPLTVEEAAEELIPPWLKPSRVRVLTESTLQSDQPEVEATSTPSSTVLYWMQRDMRTEDNWALLFAAHVASRYNANLRVVYALPPPGGFGPSPSPEQKQEHPHRLPNMTQRHAAFLLGGIKCVKKELKGLGVDFDVLFPRPEGETSPPAENTQLSMSTLWTSVAQAIHHHATTTALPVAAIITDFSPLRNYRVWTELYAAPMLDKDQIPLYQVDAHNIIPAWYVSGKREVGARTLRLKINKILDDYMTDFPKLQTVLNSLKHTKTDKDPPSTNNDDNAHPYPRHLTNTSISIKKCYTYLHPDESVPANLPWAKPGTQSGMDQFQTFCKQGLRYYDKLRNDPNHKNVQSQLSVWLNYGHVSFQRIALCVKALPKGNNTNTASFLEEGIVRRELSDNYCLYTPNHYDSLEGAADWAQETLRVHGEDEREYIYTTEEFEKGETHDDLWNAAQLQLVKEGKLHGFLRMYWAKKILEWTTSPEIALQLGLYFNDKFAIDGNDPNGFVGVGWSIMGIHDMGWKERPIFGKIRFMNYNGCKRKFKVQDFVDKYPGAERNAMRAEAKWKKQNMKAGDKKRKRS